MKEIEPTNQEVEDGFAFRNDEFGCIHFYVLMSHRLQWLCVLAPGSIGGISSAIKTYERTLGVIHLYDETVVAKYGGDETVVVVTKNSDGTTTTETWSDDPEPVVDVDV